MERLDFKIVEEFVNQQVDIFHQTRLKRLKEIDLIDVLKKKNPYLFKTKNLLKASDLINSILDAFFSSSEEKQFGDLLEQLALFIVGKTAKGYKSAAAGIDIEFIDSNVHYLISLKSGANWGNSGQYKSLENSFKKAIAILKQQNRLANIQPVLGICYGKSRTTHPRNFMKIMGQNFWHFISGSKNLYIDIIEPLGYKAKYHNDAFESEKAKTINRFIKEFVRDFCSADGEIDWKKLVEFNSGNYVEPQ
jgi:hypothetical protein